MGNTYTAACLQTRPQPDFSSALDEALELARRAVDDGASLLALPEYCGGLKSQGSLLQPPLAAQDEHPVLLGLEEFAASHKVWIVVGSLAVAGSDDKYLNRSLVIDDTGTVVSHYDKIHLFDVQLSKDEVYCESARVQPGNRAVLTATPFGIFGHSICYDVRFAQLYRTLSQAGAQILLTPAAFTKVTGQAHWHILNRARAIENGAFVIAPCAIGPIPGGGESYGHSLIVNPWGEVLADGGETPGIALARINLDEVKSARAKIPSLEHDRPFTSA